ncbi:hypothetical protein HK105_206317 [Polyrhizophydium stewartii]|uniref:MFS transporter n=1 Tax=Polyrhizophydium stewartii TaxID=2732419 RepID=A0ABR4N412_9FUNG
MRIIRKAPPTTSAPPRITWVHYALTAVASLYVGQYTFGPLLAERFGVKQPEVTGVAERIRQHLRGDDEPADAGSAAPAPQQTTAQSPVSRQ